MAIRPFIPYPGGPNIPGGGGGMKPPLPLPLIFLCWSMFAHSKHQYKMDFFFKYFFFKVNFEARNFENTMGASTSIQEYSEEVLLAATEGDVAKLMAVLESGDKIVEETEEATKGRFAFSIPFCHYYFEKLRMHLRGSHDWCTVYMRWC